MISTNKLIEKKIYIIGNRFIDFSNNKNVFTVSQFLEFISLKSSRQQGVQYILNAGQGLTDNDRKAIIKYITTHKLGNNFVCSNTLSLISRADKKLIHKHQDKNIIISEPTKISESDYKANLIIDENCSEMSDHITGQHIQGMVLIEAARQMVLAVTEKYFTFDREMGRVSFVTHSTNVNFYNFLFPLTVNIKYKVIELKRAYKNNLTCKASISFFQNDIKAAEVIFSFSALDHVIMNEKESILASNCIKKFTNSFNDSRYQHAAI